MRYRIVGTTDRQYLGKEFDGEDNPIVLDDDVSVAVERVMELPDGMRFISSSYIIDAQAI